MFPTKLHLEKGFGQVTTFLPCKYTSKMSKTTARYLYVCFVDLRKAFDKVWQGNFFFINYWKMAFVENVLILLETCTQRVKHV